MTGRVYGLAVSVMLVAMCFGLFPLARLVFGLVGDRASVKLLIALASLAVSLITSWILLRYYQPEFVLIKEQSLKAKLLIESVAVTAVFIISLLACLLLLLNVNPLNRPNL
jgi:hypothetical protein